MHAHLVFNILFGNQVERIIGSKGAVLTVRIACSERYQGYKRDSDEFLFLEFIEHVVRLAGLDFG